MKVVSIFALSSLFISNLAFAQTTLVVRHYDPDAKVMIEGLSERVLGPNSRGRSADVATTTVSVRAGGPDADLIDYSGDKDILELNPWLVVRARRISDDLSEELAIWSLRNGVFFSEYSTNGTDVVVLGDGQGAPSDDDLAALADEVFALVATVLTDELARKGPEMSPIR